MQLLPHLRFHAVSYKIVLCKRHCRITELNKLVEKPKCPPYPLRLSLSFPFFGSMVKTQIAAAAHTHPHTFYITHSLYSYTFSIHTHTHKEDMSDL